MISRRALEGAVSLAVREHDLMGDNELPSRNQVLARYRQFREIGKRHHHKILEFLSADALLHQARRLRLAHGKTLLLEHMDELYYAYDLAIYTAPAGRMRAIDRYARSARFAAGSDEAVVLAAMRASCFSILAIERRHEAAGLIATDVVRGTEVWLVDVGLESSLEEGELIATRLYTAERFSMTAGINVLLDFDMLEDILAELPRRLCEGDLRSVLDDRRFAEATYRVALADGIMDRIRYLDLPPEELI
jgi:hypothetical protein